jgi:hypothetical protein
VKYKVVSGVSHLKYTCAYSVYGFHFCVYIHTLLCIQYSIYNNTIILYGRSSQEMEDSRLKDYHVGVKEEYLLPPPAAPESSTAGAGYVRDARDEHDKSTGKKRPRDEKINPEDRLCSQTMKGNPCPYGAECRYRYFLNTRYTMFRINYGCINVRSVMTF